jgi:hypothetical protein
MAKRGRRVLPARKKARADDSLLIRSAESLGRVIGSLQRQIKGRSKRITEIANDVVVPSLPSVKNPFSKRPARKPRTTRTASARKRSTSRKSSKKR